MILKKFIKILFSLLILIFLILAGFSILALARENKSFSESTPVEGRLVETAAGKI